MASLTDLFNPTFLMFLGILVLVVALVVVYFESKLREQNHKITSMFSIVSTLAEDANGMKMGINHLMNLNNAMGGSVYQQQYFTQEPLENKRETTTKLIEVSDDEESDNEDESVDNESIADESVYDESVADDESIYDEDDESVANKSIDDDEDLDVNDLESEPDSLTESDLEEQEKITVFKLNISKGDEIISVEDNDVDDLASELSTNDLEKEQPVLDVSDLKTISINLEESIEKIDYKKLQLPKLKSIVVEKNLATSSDASKLKKAELLKLLGVE